MILFGYTYTIYHSGYNTDMTEQCNAGDPLETPEALYRGPPPMLMLKLLRHDLRIPVGSLSRFKLSLPQCNVPGVLNCMSGRLSGFPSLY